MSDDEIPEGIRRLIRDEDPHITLTTEELRLIIADCIDQIIQNKSPDEPDEIPTEDAYNLEKMESRQQLYQHLEMDRSSDFIQHVIESVEEDQDE